MLADSESISFVATLDPEMSRTFYEDTLGLTLVSDEHFALVFELNGHMLRVAKAEELAPAKHTILGWHVRDISATARGLITRGVVFETFEGLDQDDLGIWASPSGAKVAWFKDPDDNVLSLTQLTSTNAD